MSVTFELVIAILLVFAAMMYIRVELDFKRNVFRITGHLSASILLLFTVLYSFSLLSLEDLLAWFLYSIIFLFINEVIRIYLRKHSMKDILENHPRIYWIARGKIRTGKSNKKEN